MGKSAFPKSGKPVSHQEISSTPRIQTSGYIRLVEEVFGQSQTESSGPTKMHINGAQISVTVARAFDMESVLGLCYR